MSSSTRNTRRKNAPSEFAIRYTPVIGNKPNVNQFQSFKAMVATMDPTATVESIQAHVTKEYKNANKDESDFFGYLHTSNKKTEYYPEEPAQLFVLSFVLRTPNSFNSLSLLQFVLHGVSP